MAKEPEDQKDAAASGTVKKAKLVSRNRHPVFLEYKGDTIGIPAQGMVDGLDPDQLTKSLPAGVMLALYDA